MSEPAVYIVPVRASRWLNENDRMHWGRRAPLVREWRENAWAAVLVARVPRMERAHVNAFCLFGDHRRRDVGNWYPTAKACIDGIRDRRVNGALIRGILPDDDTRHLDGPHMYWRLERDVLVPTLELHIRPVEEI